MPIGFRTSARGEFFAQFASFAPPGGKMTTIRVCALTLLWDLLARKMCNACDRSFTRGPLHPTHTIKLKGRT